MPTSEAFSLPDQLFVLDREDDTQEFLDMLLTLCTFGVSVGLLLVDTGVKAIAAEHRGIPVSCFGDMGLQHLMVESRTTSHNQSSLPDTAIPVDEPQIQDLYARVPRILHP
ncbi:hypothetical protein [Salicola sp. Rm-C-2C1-2]|uniref:hypothetical protein n=1 Tax=Salicola sp. Rm-C-2C1-2 TaxID=3141321 RepID=UPI0032E457EB